MKKQAGSLRSQKDRPAKGWLRLTLLAVEGPEFQSFSFHLALFLVAGPVLFTCLPCFSQSELVAGWSYGLCTNVAPFPFQN
eukprot:1145873-Pelagomonas_calceolata.AAC.3